jgi:hypothetical protein
LSFVLTLQSLSTFNISFRLWVHEALRNLYDRLFLPSQKSVIFDCIKTCVKTVFRENFDSAFEHLGKVDGQVTQQNLRNLLFGSYMPTSSAATDSSGGGGGGLAETTTNNSEGGADDDDDALQPASLVANGAGAGAAAASTDFVEVQSFDALETRIQKAVDNNDEKKGKNNLVLLPIR